MDENEFEFEGVSLVARIVNEMAGCDGCYFDENISGCSNYDRPRCHKFFRIDKKQIIFVEKQQ